MFYIKSCGKAVPDDRVTNDDLSQYLETNDEWITTRTGIKERRVIKDGIENTATLSVAAGTQALENAGISADKIDCVIVATSSPAQPIPSTANLVARELDIVGPAFDINVACSGFVYGLAISAGLFSQKLFKNILLIGADSLSSFVDKHDRSTVILFGDGAGAVVLSATDDSNAGLIACDLGGESDLVEILEVKSKDSEGQASAKQRTDPNKSIEGADPNYEKYLHMNGKEVFKVAVRAVEESIKNTLEKADLKPTDVDWLLLHQANIRIIDAITERLGIDKDKALSNIADYGNTSAASIPILLAEVAEQNRFKDGDLLVFCGFGAGMTWGTCIMRWHETK